MPDTMRSMRLVQQEHLNHHGYMFGGTMLSWLDEQAFMAAAELVDESANMVTVGIDRVEFKNQVMLGSILKFDSILAHVGNTSLTMLVDVLCGRECPKVVFSAYVTFCCLGNDGKAVLMGSVMHDWPVSRDSLDTAGQARWDEVERQRSARKQQALRTFMDLRAAGKVGDDAIDGYVSLWHTGAGAGLGLNAYLGMTAYEYTLWAMGKSTPTELLNSRRIYGLDGY